MSENIATQKQTYFKPLSVDQEGATILQSSVTRKSIIQLKNEKTKTMDFTRVQPYRVEKSMIYARAISGPTLDIAPATMLMELGLMKYFGQVQIVSLNPNFEIKVLNLYELQRRNFFRVSLVGGKVEPRFTLSNGNSFTLTNIGVGGIAIAFDPNKDMKIFEVGAILRGKIRIMGQEEVEIDCMVKHRKRRPGEKGAASYVAGCEFRNVTESMKQKLAFIVNDYYRQYFLKIQK